MTCLRLGKYEKINDAFQLGKENNVTSQEKSEAFRRRMSIFIPNRAAIAPEVLSQYRDRYVAWNPEGTAIIVATEHDEEIHDLIRAAGYDPGDCVVEFIS